jgi:hypothetical protein
MALNSSRPDSLADWMISVPAPIPRSKMVCRNRTSLMASSGISIDRLAIHPSRWMTRSLVTTKCDVSHHTRRRSG